MVVRTAFRKSKQAVSHAYGVAEDGLSPVGHFLAGMLTGAVVSFVEGPIDLLKSQVVLLLNSLVNKV